MAGRTIGHFEVLEKLGEGGMGAVYKARDHTLQRLVALKMVSAEQAADPSRRRYFIREAKAASALNHPNIITIYEIDEWEGTDYIAMEYIDGRTLRSLVDARTDFPTLLPILRQLAEALATAHAAGIVHRDIKPDNLMLRADGYVKVLDFGIARLKRGTDSGKGGTMTRPGMLVGTAAYMSPEQARGDSADSPSDVFSLGIVFYQLATGRHPFPAGSTPFVLKAITTETPIPPARLNPDVPPAFQDLILRMLSKEPVLRPTAATVLAELFLLGHGDAAPASVRSGPPPRQGVGREKEMRELRSEFETAATGWTMVCVTGEAGLGKTTLVEDFLEELRARPGTAWIGRGRSSERLGGSDALLPILEGLDSLMRGESGDLAARILKRFAPTWYRHIAPAMGEPEEALAEQARTASRERMKFELSSFLQELARVQPIVLFFDDMHWSDVSTCDMIGYLGSACRDSPVLLLATYRPSGLRASKHPFLQVKAALQTRGSCRDLPLEFLEREDVERLVAAKFPDHQFPPGLLDLVHAKTEGNPLFIADILHYLRDRAVVAQKDGAWVLVQPLSEIEKEVPASIRSMIQLKIDQLSDLDRRLLLAAAVQGVELDSAVLAKALSLDPADVEERLQELDGVHDFVRVVAEQEFPDRTLSVRYRFVHVFYQNALYGSLTPSRRASMSATVAQTILGFGGGNVPARAADLAFLFESARDFAQASPFFLSAARYAARVFAYPEAAILARKGLVTLQSLPASAGRDRLELPLSVTLGIAVMATSGYAAPDLEHTHLRSRELCLRLRDKRTLFPVLWALYSYYLIGGQLQKALEVAQEMLPQAEASGDATVVVQALLSLGSALGYMGRLREAREHLERVPTLYDPSQHPFYASVYVLDPGVTSLAMLGHFLVLMGHPDEGLRRVEEAAQRARDLDHPQSLAYAIFHVAWVHHDRGEVAPTRQMAEVAMALCKEYGFHQIHEWSRMMRGWALAADGSVPEGVEEMQRSLTGQLEMHARLERPYCLGLLARSLARIGRYDEALASFDEALAILESNEERSYEAEVHRLRGEVLMARAFELEDTIGVPTEDGGVAGAEEALIAEAETELVRAIAAARRPDAKMLELRAATSLLKLWRSVGDAASGRAALAETLGWFTEGAGTPYLVEARNLIASA